MKPADRADGDANATSLAGKIAAARRPASGFAFPYELLFLVPVLIAANCWMFTRVSRDSLTYLPTRILAGEWWRVFTHPFVHLSWYHLLLDAGAVVTTYFCLSERSMAKRLMYFLFSAVGTTLVAHVASPLTERIGLCGLSGVAYGLIAVYGLKMMDEDRLRGRSMVFGLVCLIVVTACAMVEAITGKGFYSYMDFGMLGQPIAIAHAGGVLGGIVGYALANKRWEKAMPRRE